MTTVDLGESCGSSLSFVCIQPSDSMPLSFGEPFLFSRGASIGDGRDGAASNSVARKSTDMVRSIASFIVWTLCLRMARARAHQARASRAALFSGRWVDHAE